MQPAASDSSALVLAAVEMGWCMAELYAAIRPADLAPPPAPDKPLPVIAPPADNERIQLQADLPGLSALTDRQDLDLQIDRVSAGLRRLGPEITAAGLAVPTNGSWAQLLYHRHSAEGRYELARAVLEFHADVLVVLTAADHQAGRAYGLGRAVADLAMRPSAADQDSFTRDFRGRVETITGWLAELRTSLPAHAAGAVAGSIEQWQQWSGRPTWQGQPLVWAAHNSLVLAALADQGKRWRLLLTGQVSALDQLSPEDYVQAAGFLVGRVRRIAQRLVIQYWPLITGLTVAMAGAVAGSLLLLSSPAAKGVGVAVSVFGWLGITGRSASAELSRIIGHAEQSLWGAELDLAAGWANTQLPPADRDRFLGETRPPAMPGRRVRTRR